MEAKFKSHLTPKSKPSEPPQDASTDLPLPPPPGPIFQEINNVTRRCFSSILDSVMNQTRWAEPGRTTEANVSGILFGIWKEMSKHGQKDDP